MIFRCFIGKRDKKQQGLLDRYGCDFYNNGACALHALFLMDSSHSGNSDIRFAAAKNQEVKEECLHSTS